MDSKTARAMEVKAAKDGADKIAALERRAEAIEASLKRIEDKLDLIILMDEDDGGK